MRCDQAETELCAYLDGELSVERATEMAGHLAGCRACDTARAAAERLAQVVAEVEAEPPAGFDPARLWQAIAATRQLSGVADTPLDPVRAAFHRGGRRFGRRVIGGRWRLASAAALAAGAAFASWTLLREADAPVRMAQRQPATERGIDPQFFIDFPVVRQLDRFQVLDAVLDGSPDRPLSVGCGDRCP